MVLTLFTHLRTRFFWSNLLLLVPLAICSAHLIVTHDRTETLSEFFRMPAYFRSIAYSGVIALLLLLAVYGVSFEMNRRHGGSRMNRRWLGGQFLYGVLGVVLLELFAATLLFHLHGFWILDTAYFKKLFGPIALFIFSANLCYMVYYLSRRSAVKVRYQFLDNKVATEEDRVVVKLSEPAIFYIKNGDVWCVDFEGGSMMLHTSLTANMELLSERDYFRGARDWIVHRRAIGSVVHVSGNRLKLRCSIGDGFDLEVSRRNVGRFKEWLDGGSLTSVLKLPMIPEQFTSES